jgi:tryptophan-rich sensory protein
LMFGACWMNITLHIVIKAVRIFIHKKKEKVMWILYFILGCVYLLFLG